MLITQIYEAWRALVNVPFALDIFILACWSIWKMRNKICFEGEKLHSPLDIVRHACALIKFWAGLQKEVDKEMLIQGVDTMIKIALQLLSKKHQAVTRSN